MRRVFWVTGSLKSAPGGLTAPATVTEQVALQQQVLEEDIASQAALLLPGLPLNPRDEVHVPADARGVALRQALCDFRVLGQRRPLAA